MKYMCIIFILMRISLYSQTSPPEISRYVSIFYEFADVKEHFAQEEKVDTMDMEIRFWKYKNYFPYIYGLQIKKDSDAWSAYRFKQEKFICNQISWVYDKVINKLDRVHIVSVTPESGWEKFYTKLNNTYNIFYPPSGSIRSVLDGDFIALEIFYKGNYGCYIYNLGIKEERKSIEYIFEYFEDELD